jgi:hypothetical protein
LKQTVRSILKPASGLVIEVLDGECLVYHPQQTRAFYLNKSAALILGLCDGMRDADEISKLICDGYPEGSTSLLAEVTAAMSQLEEYGLLVRT